MKRLADIIGKSSPEVLAAMAVFDQMYHDAAAEALWGRDPEAALVEYGLPCWCGHYGGCAKCEDES